MPEILSAFQARKLINIELTLVFFGRGLEIKQMRAKRFMDDQK